MIEQVWIGEQFNSPEEFREWEEENQYRILSPSRISSISSCPRKFQHHYDDRIRAVETATHLDAGGLLHTGIDSWYFTGDIEQAIEQMRQECPEDYSPGPDEEYLTLPHLEIIVRNYADHWSSHGSYTPLEVNFSDLNLDSVLAARWRMSEEGKVVLSESPIMMLLENPHGEPFIMSGIADLPVKNYAGNHFVMDHKSTKGYLSDWWKGKYRISDQFRIYILMLSELLGVPFQGTILDGIYMGKYATSTTSTATKFDRDEYAYDATMLQETRENIHYHQESIKRYRAEGYFPQSTGTYCGFCRFLRLCRDPVWARDPLPPELKVETDNRSILD